LPISEFASDGYLQFSWNAILENEAMNDAGFTWVLAVFIFSYAFVVWPSESVPAFMRVL
jgi:hypothetical protein